MELLCLKCDDHRFLRITDDSYELTLMNKASVYPMSEYENVKMLFREFQNKLENLHIIKLTITEEKMEL